MFLCIAFIMVLQVLLYLKNENRLYLGGLVQKMQSETGFVRWLVFAYGGCEQCSQ